MKRKIPARDPERAHMRRKIASRRVGRRHCPCGERRPRALLADKHPIVCIRCDRKQRRQRTEDDHHIIGIANDSELTIRVDTNDHYADLTTAQEDWPHQKTRHNPDGSPLLRIAASVRGYIDVVWYLIEKCVLWIPDAIEAVDEWLAARLGPTWWKNTPLERFAPTT